MRHFLKRLTIAVISFLFVCVIFPLPQFPSNINISEVGEWGGIDYSYSDMAVSGNYAYCIDFKRFQLDIVDISIPSSPRLAASYPDPPDYYVDYIQVEVVGNRAYIVVDYFSAPFLYVLDISEPSVPSLWSKVRLSGDTRSGTLCLCVGDRYAYIGNNSEQTIDIVDISGAAPLDTIITYHAGWGANGLRLSGDYLVASTDRSGIKILDISTPTSPSFVSEIEMEATGFYNSPDCIFVAGSHLYSIDSFEGDDILYIYDISSPKSPVKIGEYLGTQYSRYLSGVTVAGSLAFLRGDGLTILDVSDPSAPVFKSESEFLGGNDVQIEDSLAYIASGGRGLRVVDVSDPTAPQWIGGLEDYGFIGSIARRGNYLYIGRSYGFQVMDISTPSAPTHVSIAEYDGLFTVLAVSGSHVFAATNSSSAGFYVFDVSDPSNPTWTATIWLDFNDWVRFISINGNYAYVVCEKSLIIVDISNPDNPVKTDSLSIPGTSLCIHGNYAYLLASSGITVLDISVPSTPRVLDTVSLLEPRRMAIKGNYAYVISLNEGVLVYDLSNPASPSLAATRGRGGDGDITIDGNYAYLYNFDNKIDVIDISTPVSPQLAGTYSFASSGWEHPGFTVQGGYIHVHERRKLSVLRFQYQETPPRIALDRDSLYFHAAVGGSETPTQSVRVENETGGTLQWRISTSDSWIEHTPSYSGIGSGELRVWVDARNLGAGTYTGTLYVKNTISDFDTKTVTVHLRIYDPSETTVPFGEMATPPDNAAVSGSVPFTGWALDDIGVEEVKIYLVSGNASTPIGDAIFVEGARPDIESAYPTYPMASRAGWGYMMLTNFLPNGGNGTYTFSATAVDMEGNEVTLGTKTIYVDNANAVKPFGAVDTPGQGDTASGAAYANYGWALTPPPNTIPMDGSTILVWVDGQSVGSPVYNQYRSDIEGLFPGYTNSGGAGGLFYLDTTKYTNGVHTIYWTAADNAGNSEGIGSRYFSIQNSQNRSAARTAAGTPKHVGNVKPFTPVNANGPVDVDRVTPVWVRKGFVVDGEFQHRYPADNGETQVELKELERLEIALLHPDELFTGSGGVMVEPLSPLPIGASLDVERGIFYWIPGPGFLGDYSLVFLVKDAFGNVKRKDILIRIKPKF